MKIAFKRIATPLLISMVVFLVSVIGAVSLTSYVQLEEAMLASIQTSTDSSIRGFHRGLIQELPPGHENIDVYLEVSVSTSAPVVFPSLVRDREEMKRLLFVAPDARVIGTVDGHPAPPLRGSLKALIAGRRAASILYGDELVVFIPLERDGTVLGGTLAIFDGARLSAAKANLLFRTLSFFAGFLAIGIGVGLILMRRMTQPLGAISRSIGAVAGGNLDEEIPLQDRQDELGTVATSLVVMREEIRQRILELKQREREQRVILSSLSEGVIALDADGMVTELNPAAVEVLETDRDTILGTSFDELRTMLTPVNRPALADSAVYAVNTRIVQMSSSPLVGTDTIGEVWVLRDISREEELEERLRHNLKMEAIGRLAGGIAHDFNNLLTGILGATQLAQLQVGADSKAQENLSIVLSACERAGELNSKLQAFSRKESYAVKDVNIHSVIEDTLALFNRGHKTDLDVLVEPNAKHFTVSGDATELQSALLNLCVNAKDAMANGGTLCIKTRNVNDHKIAISVEDTGTGIPLELQSSIFEPFFTTKDKGKGTGLGLAAVYGTIEAHKGAIELKSEVGEGTTFTIVLPCVSDSETAATPASR